MSRLKPIVKQINADLPIDFAWMMWTTNTGLKSFMAPDCDVELKLFGKYEIYFLLDREYGQRGSEGCKILSFVPREMLSFTWNAPPQFLEIRESGEHTYVVMNFEEISKGRTKITLRHFGWGEGEEWEEVHEYFDHAWSKVFEWMDRAIQSGSE